MSSSHCGCDDTSCAQMLHIMSVYELELNTIPNDAIDATSNIMVCTWTISD